MNFMKRNVFTKNDGPVTKQHHKSPTTNYNGFQENYQDMMSNFLSLSPSDKESNVSKEPVQQHTTKPKEKSTSNQKSESSRHNTTSLDEDVSYIMALSEGRGHARCEVGMAAININSPNLILCQLSDNFWYSGTLTKLNILNAIEILVPNTYITAHGESKLIKYIQTMYPKVKITPIPRRHFNESLGIELIRKLCAPSHQNIALQITEKFYTLASTAALLNYLQFIKLIKFVPSTLKIEYQAKYGTMLIDVETSQRLELLYSLSDEKTPKSSLFGVLNYCVTAIGKRNLRAKILQPMCDIPLIKSSHSCVRELLEKGEILFNLKNILKQFGRVDKLLNLAVSVPEEDNVKAAEIMINQALLLKSCLENIPKLYEILAEIESSSFQNIRKCLEDPRYNYLLEKINSILSNAAGGLGSSQYFQRLYAVKPNINDLLDTSRKMYSDKVDAISEIVKELVVATKLPLRMMHTLSRGFHMQMTLMRNQTVPSFPESFEILSRNGCHTNITTLEISTLNYEIKEIIDMIQISSNIVVSKLLMDIRQEIDAIYHLTGFITELDIIQSLTTASKIGNYCEPTISESIKIKNGIHPLLEHNIDRTECVPNNVIAVPEYNFYLITGPNMGGKSIYIKMIAILQIMFQIGCFIPARSAEFRICDKLFSRIGLSDNIENGSSSFIVEMREMEYIIKNITPNSLVIIDELCRSTNPEEGKILAWRICEKLITMKGVSNDGKYYKDGTSDGKDETTNDDANHKLLSITSPFVFVATHYLELTKLNEQYHSVINLHLSAEQKIIDQEEHLQYLHKVESGVTPISRYGLALARNVRFPCDILPRAEEILNEIVSNSSTSHLDFSNITFNTTRDSVKITQIEKGLYDLTYNIVSILRGQHTKAGQLKQINKSLDEFARTQNNEFVTLIQNQTFNEILNISVANATGKIGNKSLTIDTLTVDKASTTTLAAKTSDLSYHSLKRRIEFLEAKEQKKVCTANSNELKKPEIFSIPKQKDVPKTNSEEQKKQLSAAKCEINQTSYKASLRPESHRAPENKHLNKLANLNGASSSYQANLRYSSNQCLNYKSNLPKNHNLNFMDSKTVKSMFNKFLEGFPKKKPQLVSSSLIKPADCDLANDTDLLCEGDDIEIPEICIFSPGINTDVQNSLNSSQIIAQSSNENYPSLRSETFYNVSELVDSQNEALKYSSKGELSYQTDLYLKNIFQNEMKKHSTYKTSKVKDNRILKEQDTRKCSPVPKSTENSYAGNHISNFFSKRVRSTTPISTTTSSSLANQSKTQPIDVPRKPIPLPKSTITLSSLKLQKPSGNFFTNGEVVRSPRLISAEFSYTNMSTLSKTSVYDQMSSINSFTIESTKPPERRVTFNIDELNQQTDNTSSNSNKTTHSERSPFTTPLSNKTSSSLANQRCSLPYFKFNDLARTSTILPKLTVAKTSLKSSRHFFTPSQEMVVRPLRSISRCTTPTSTITQSSSRHDPVFNINLINPKLIETNKSIDRSVTYSLDELSQRTNQKFTGEELNSVSSIETSTKDDVEMSFVNSARSIRGMESDMCNTNYEMLDEHLALSPNSIDPTDCGIISSTMYEDSKNITTDSTSRVDKFNFEDEPIFSQS